MEEVVIVGGGVAGLSCLNALLDQGVSPLLLEGSTIGAPKMCGEFLAPQAVTLLQNWDIAPIQEIRQAHFFSQNKKFEISFSKPAGAISRSEAELLLAKRPQKKGGRLRENALIQEVIPGTETTPYTIHLSTGEQLVANSVIFATGKYGQTRLAPQALPYFGVKLHFRHIVQPGSLLMYSLKNAYFGLVPVSAEMSNCAFLIKRAVIDKAGSCKEFLFRLAESNLVLKQAFEASATPQFDWLESRAPDFQFKTLPAWPRAFWIGDALAGLHPAIGSGFSHGISSALMATEFYLQNNPTAYLRLAKQSLGPKMFLGKLMHKLMLNPILSSIAFPFLHHNPLFLNGCLRRLGYRD